MNRKELSKQFGPMLQVNQAAFSTFHWLLQNENAPDDAVYAFCFGAADSLFVTRQVNSRSWRDMSKYLEGINYEWYAMIREWRSEEAMIDAREMFYITEQIRAMRENDKDN